MTTTTPLNIAASFITEIAARFQMPELATAKFEQTEAKRYSPGTLLAVATVAPTGQMAALVATLQVTVTVKPSHVAGMHHAVVELRYGHHGGGSNGKDMDFAIITQKRFGSDLEYVGSIENSLFRQAQSLLHRYAEEAEKI